MIFNRNRDFGKLRLYANPRKYLGNRVAYELRRTYANLSADRKDRAIPLNACERKIEKLLYKQIPLDSLKHQQKCFQFSYYVSQ